MSVVLVRHGAAGDRRDWDGDDDLRPLDDRGRQQAEGLVRLLASYGVKRVLSSPSVRCVETVRPLADAAGLPVEERAELAEGEGKRAVRVARELASEGVPTAICTHGDVIPRILTTMAVEDGLDLGADPRWKKGSAWVLEGDGERFVRAEYLPPPK